MAESPGKSSVEWYLAVPPSGRGPGILVLHAWWGLTDVIRGVCDRLAADGFVALAPDLFHGSTAATIEEAERLTSTADAARVRKDLASALEELRALPGVANHPLGVLGFSFGAYFSLELASERGAEIGAVVVYYGTGDADFGKARAAFLGHFAENDSYEPAPSVQEFERRLRAAEREATIYVYPGTGHWFSEEDRKDAYDAKAAGLSWDLTIAFLKQRLR